MDKEVIREAFANQENTSRILFKLLKQQLMKYIELGDEEVINGIMEGQYKPSNSLEKVYDMYIDSIALEAQLDQLKN